MPPTAARYILCIYLNFWNILHTAGRRPDLDMEFILYTLLLLLLFTNKSIVALDWTLVVEEMLNYGTIGGVLRTSGSSIILNYACAMHAYGHTFCMLSFC